VIWIDNARILSILAVVFAHTCLRIPGARTDTWSAVHFYVSFCCWAVPILLMISGALLLDPAKARNISHFYRRRLLRIGLPTVIWTVFYVLWFDKDVIKHFLLTGEVSWQGKYITALAWDWLNRIAAGKACYHLWYVYTIPGVFLIAPFLSKLIAALSRRERFLFLSLLFSFTILHGESHTVFITSCVPFLCYFVAGYVILRSEILIKTSHAVIVFLVSGLITAVADTSVEIITGAKKEYFLRTLGPSAIPMSFSLFFLIRRLNFPLLGTRLTRQLGEVSFGIYLIHPAVIEVLERFVLNTGIAHPAISVPLEAVCVFLLSAAACTGIQAMPFLHKILTAESDYNSQKLKRAWAMANRYFKIRREIAASRF
jgi:surface polysaccharide O-acyltransferase-like enzyme